MIVHENRVFPFIGLSQPPSPVTKTSRRFSMGTSHFIACMQARLSRRPGAATPQNDATAQQMKMETSAVYGPSPESSSTIAGQFLVAFFNNDGPGQRFDGALQIQDHESREDRPSRSAADRHAGQHPTRKILYLNAYFQRRPNRNLGKYHLNLSRKGDIDRHTS
jgi:hypothetical protein